MASLSSPPSARRRPRRRAWLSARLRQGPPERRASSRPATGPVLLVRRGNALPRWTPGGWRRCGWMCGRGSQSAIVLNLFADTELKAVFGRTEPTAAGYTLTGRIEGQAHSTVVLAVNGDMVAGTAWTHDGIHTIEAIGGAAVIRQARPGAFGQCADPAQAQRPADRAPSRAQGPTTHRPTTHDDDGSVIDLLVVYPSVVRRFLGGHRFTRAFIDRDVALAKSGQINLLSTAHARRVDNRGRSTYCTPA